jgi:uncharacterized cupin superfamily protein
MRMNSRRTLLGGILLLAACVQEGGSGESRRALAGSSGNPNFLTYGFGQWVDPSTMVDLTPAIGALGGTVLNGDPHIAARFDYQSSPESAGIFYATRGAPPDQPPAKIRIDFPCDEKMVVIGGLLRLTDLSTGNVVYMGPGDSYFMKKHNLITWEVLTPEFEKSFFDLGCN